MRILYATQWFEPEPILKGIGFAKLMASHGHHVRVVTGFPNYPSGKLYPGYRLALLRRGVSDGIEVDRVPLVPSHSRSAMGRALNYLSFAVSLTVYGLVMRRPRCALCLSFAIDRRVGCCRHRGGAANPLRL